MTEKTGSSKENFFKQNKLVLLALVVVFMLGGFVYFMGNADQVFLKNGVVRGQSSSGKVQIGGSFTMTDQNGHVFTEKNLLGSPTLMFFGFTHCPDVCPTTLSTMTEVLATLPEKLRKTIKVVFVTVDPARDTPEVMKEFLANFDKSYIGLSGTEDQLHDMAKKFLVYYAKNTDSDPEHYLMDHSAYIYLFDKKGEYVTHFSHELTVDTISAKLQQAL